MPKKRAPGPREGPDREEDLSNKGTRVCTRKNGVHPAGRRVPWPADLRSTAASGTHAVLEIVYLIITWVLTTVREIRRTTPEQGRRTPTLNEPVIRREQPNKLLLLLIIIMMIIQMIMTMIIIIVVIVITLG